MKESSEVMIKVMEGGKLIHRVTGDNERRNKVSQVVAVDVDQVVK
jgi:hypothetical protein